MAPPPRPQCIVFPRPRVAELQDLPRDDSPPGPGQFVGRTLVSLVSAGTEVTGCLAGNLKGAGFPIYPGYAAVVRVEHVGQGVTHIAPGQRVLFPGGHRSHQRGDAARAVVVPPAVADEVAPFARMAKICMPALVHARTRPPERVAALSALRVARSSRGRF